MFRQFQAFLGDKQVKGAELLQNVLKDANIIEGEAERVDRQTGQRTERHQADEKSRRRIPSVQGYRLRCLPVIWRTLSYGIVMYTCLPKM